MRLMPSHRTIDEQPPLRDLTQHSQQSLQAQGYLAMRIASAGGAAPDAARGGEVAERFVRLLADAIRFTLMEYCVGRALGTSDGGRPSFALLLAPAPEVAHLCGRAALLYGVDASRWVSDEVVAPLPLDTPPRLPSGAPDDPAWMTPEPVNTWNALDQDVGRRRGEYASLTEALGAALADGYLLLAAILERTDTTLGSAWRRIAHA
jgi:hypothetical protein